MSVKTNIGPKRLVVGAHYGLTEWLLQRVTAVIMAAYTLLLLVVYFIFGNPSYEGWSSLFANYSDLKQMLTEKYAKPTDVVELFDVSPFPQPLDDNDKMHEVKLDKCRYSSLWKTNNGEIHLFIDHFGLSSCFVRLFYLDKTNSAIIKEKAKEDL